MQVLNEYDYIILDFDNTLVSLDADWDVLKANLVELFGPFKHIDDLIDEDNKDEIYGIISEFECQQEFRINWPLVKYIKYNRDKSYAICSNNVTTVVEKTLKALRIYNYFDIIIGRDNIMHVKPSGEGIEKIIDNFNVERTDIIYIGDNKNDQIAADNCNIKFHRTTVFDNKKTFLDSIAEEYTPADSSTDFDYQILLCDLETLIRNITGNDIVELGCSQGIMTEKLAKVCDHLTVVEGSINNINFVKDIIHDDNVNFVHSLWQDYDILPKFSDIIFASGLEHISDSEGLTLLSVISKNINHNGHLHIIVPNMKSLHRRIAKNAGLINSFDEPSDLDKKLGHKTFYDIDKLQSIIKSAGFKIDKIEGIFLKPLPNKQMLDLNLTPEEIKGFYKTGQEFPDLAAHIYMKCIKEAKE